MAGENRHGRGHVIKDKAEGNVLIALGPLLHKVLYCFKQTVEIESL